MTRRPVQTAVIFLVLAAGAAAALLGLTLVTNSNELFLTAFTRSHGAQLAVTVSSAKVTSAQLATTGQLPGVTQAAGPYPETYIKLTTGHATGRPPAGRKAPGAAPARPGEPGSGNAGHVAGRGGPPGAVRPAG